MFHKKHYSQIKEYKERLYKLRKFCNFKYFVIILKYIYKYLVHKLFKLIIFNNKLIYIEIFA